MKAHSMSEDSPNISAEGPSSLQKNAQRLKTVNISGSCHTSNAGSSALICYQLKKLSE